MLRGGVHTSFCGHYVRHRFDQSAQECVSFMLDQALFDLPVSDGRQLRLTCIFFLKREESNCDQIGQVMISTL